MVYSVPLLPLLSPPAPRSRRSPARIPTAPAGDGDEADARLRRRHSRVDWAATSTILARNASRRPPGKPESGRAGEEREW
eukprot:scaffold29927_cov23-Tisochrysis_lutea.AAC.2